MAEREARLAQDRGEDKRRAKDNLAPNAKAARKKTIRGTDQCCEHRPDQVLQVVKKLGLSKKEPRGGSFYVPLTGNIINNKQIC